LRIPLSTYRVQFGREFGFREARTVVPYLHRLGVSDVYASPIFHAHSDSSSGYDIVDPTRLNPVLGSWDEFTSFCGELKRHDMGLVLDIVPNHMSANSSNLWWKDVLENGPSSPYAYYFDIEWDPPSRTRSGKMLWPILGAPYAEALERRELVLKFSEEGFAIQYFERSLPIDPATYGVILSQVQHRLDPDGNGATGGPVASELAALAGLIQSLPPSSTTDAETVNLRRSQTRELKRRLRNLFTTDDTFRPLLEECLRTFNGVPEDPRSFDLLDDLLGQQSYVLSFWRVAREKVNYRRFFDITDLVGINVEEPEVFAATHSLIFQLVDEGWITGLRIDHIDGLYDPSEYLRRLRERLPDCFIVVEKILEKSEQLSAQWPVSGTTGYDFINAVGSVVLEPSGLDRLTHVYREITGGETALDDLVYEQRKRVIEELFAGEAHSLSLHLNLLAEQDRYAKDASPRELYSALVEVTACLPVYRTYTWSFQIHSQDLLLIEQSLREARRRNSGLSDAIWSFIRRVLLLDCPPSLTAEQRAGWKQFVQRWQQFSGPVMAKGKEDTAFYLYNRLISMNEVGGQDQPWTAEEFHRFAEARAKSWPHSLNAGTTHDTKRGEDARARIHVLAAIPEVWLRSVNRWRRFNSRCKRVLHGVSVPDPNEEYFIYQTLVGAWPLDPGEMDTFQDRLQRALLKSWREAKLHTNWSDPNTDYESAVADFVTTILTAVAENRFLPDFVRFHRRIAASGALLSLSQTLLRLVAPGVPDIYQGSELWDFSLVDPDNRRPVDFAKRETLLAELIKRNLSDLQKNWYTGAVKQFLIQKGLCCRRDDSEVFSNGEYIPVEAVGPSAHNLIAFARHSGMAWIIAVVPRFPPMISKQAGLRPGKDWFTDTDLTFPGTAPRRWSNLLTREKVEVPGSGHVPIAAILNRFPVALLSALPD
jgi:(1->4)-alpha-D-glucan 1-alpha-D-glucosylmutase